MTTEYYRTGPAIQTSKVIMQQIQYMTKVAGGAINQWDVVFQDGAFVRQANATAPSTMDGVGLATVAAVSGQQINILIRGAETIQSGWTSGGLIYVAAVAGQMTQTPPTASGEVVQQIALALTQNSIEVHPQKGILNGE